MRRNHAYSWDDETRVQGVSEADVRRLRDEDPKAFSALTVVDETRAIIVLNDGHTQERQANSLAHELAHVLLKHPAVPMLNEYGARTLTKEHEDEADWLAGCLLVPGSGIAATMQSCGNDLDLAAAHYGVSVELMRWRHNMPKHGPALQMATEPGADVSQMQSLLEMPNPPSSPTPAPPSPMPSTPPSNVIAVEIRSPKPSN